MPPSPSASPAPKGRNIPAQGKALGSDDPTNPSPEGAWPLVAIRDITRHHSGNSKLIKGKLFDSPGLGRFPGFSASGQDVWLDKFDREGDAIIVSAVGARCGKCFIARGQWSAIANTHVVWPDEEKVDLKYLWYLLNDEDFWVRSGSAQPFVATRKTFEKEIPLPPLPEQRRIVARIEELFSRLDAGVAALRHAKAQLQRYRQSVLAAAVTGQLTQAWREQHPDTEPAERLLERILKQRREQWDGSGKYKEPLGYSGENPFDTPPSWALTNFEQVSRRVTVGHVGSMKNEYTESGVPFLRGQNVRANRFDPNGLKFVSRGFHLSLSKSLIRGGDIAVTRSGDVGIACVIPEELGEANCSDLVLIQGPVLIDPNFAAYFMNSLGRRLVQEGKVGVAITHFNTQAVAAMPLPLPPLAEQHQIVAEVEARTTVINHLEAELDRQITRSNRLRQSTLASAFSGNI